MSGIDPLAARVWQPGGRGSWSRKRGAGVLVGSAAEVGSSGQGPLTDGKLQKLQLSILKSFHIQCEELPYTLCPDSPTLLALSSIIFILNRLRAICRHYALFFLNTPGSVSQERGRPLACVHMVIHVREFSFWTRSSV